LQKRAGTVVRLASPLKALAQRFGFLLLVAATFGVMLLGKADTLLVERLRISVADGLAPVLETVSEPVQAFDRAVVEFRQMAELRQINADLRAENERLLAWHHRARQLEAENAGLRDILNVAPEPGTRFVTARVIGDTGSAFVRSVLVAAGADDGIVKGNAALAGEGLAGRVADVGDRVARVLLVTDLNSRIPIAVGPGGERGVLAGDNSAEPRLLYLPPGHEVKPGDRVVTSGHGGVFPQGLPVGLVSSVGEQGIRVRPYVDWRSLDYLKLVDYELPGLIAPLLDRGSDPTRR